MKLCARRFNIYLALVAAILTGGCRTSPQDKANQAVGALRIHLQAPAASNSQAISLLRSDPVSVNITHDPVLTETDLLSAAVINVTGGFAIQLQFDETSSLLLEQYSAANPGKHFVIFGQWGEKLANGRWLAAPLITRRIPDGVLTFTPDASRDEADQLVLGLKNVAKKSHKSVFK